MGRPENYWNPDEIERRFWGRVKRTDLCWLWQGHLSLGYGHFYFAPGKSTTAHRIAYEYAIGPIPEGLQIDHLCRNRACVNPDHLEAVTQRENALRGFSPAARQARQTHCKRGHPLEGYNLIKSNGKRWCRACRHLADKRRYQKRKKDPKYRARAAANQRAYVARQRAKIAAGQKASP